MKQFLLLSSFLLAGVFSLSAQKYGYLNFGNLVSAMPETKAADEELEAFQTQLISKGEEMATAFQEKYGQFASDVQNGVLSPVQQQEQQQALQAEQQKIVQYEQEVRQKVEAKRQEVLKPIFDKAQAAIDVVAKENGYVMIFDTSTFNAVLFGAETDDILALVKTNLGL